MEQVDIIDEKGNILYQTSKQEAHERGLLHKTVVAEVINSRGEMVLIKQTSDRQDAGKIINPIGGHVSAGESNEDALKRAGIEEADIFLSLTQGDNRNVLAAQIAKHIFNVPRVVCRIYDPLRAEMYSTLGLEIISPTIVFAQLLKDKLES